MSLRPVTSGVNGPSQAQLEGEEELEGERGVEQQRHHR